MKTTSKRLPRDISDEYSKRKFQAGYLEQPNSYNPLLIQQIPKALSLLGRQAILQSHTRTPCFAL